MGKSIIIFALIIIFYMVIGYIGEEYKLIPKEAIRLRVLANSNSSYDQEIKNKVSDELQKEMYNLLKDVKGIDEARKVIVSNLDNFNIKVDKLLKRENYGFGYKIDFSYHYFPEKEYKGLKYDEGYYESLLVSLGSGSGDNWWCVLFPPLCLLEAEESSDVEYKFFIKELIEKYI